MRVKDVVTLKEVADDMNDGKAFYDQRESGVGDYFWDSLLADIESLIIHAGIHNRKYGLIECLPSDFLMPSITKSWMKLPMLSLCCLCVGILHGLRKDWKGEANKKLLADNEQAKSDEEISCIFTTRQACSTISGMT